KKTTPGGIGLGGAGRQPAAPARRAAALAYRKDTMMVSTNGTHPAPPAPVPQRFAPATASRPRPGAPRLAGPVHLAGVPADPRPLAAIPKATAERFRIVPVEHRGDCLLVAMVDTADVHAIDELARLAGCRVVPVAARPDDIQLAIARFYGTQPAADAGVAVE